MHSSWVPHQQDNLQIQLIVMKQVKSLVDSEADRFDEVDLMNFANILHILRIVTVEVLMGSRLDVFNFP